MNMHFIFRAHAAHEEGTRLVIVRSGFTYLAS
jgi:hypothetical protein